jgi:hypothetical protein
MHRHRYSHSSPETQTPARAPATRTIRTLAVSHRHRSSPTARDHNRFRLRIAGSLTLQSPRLRPSQTLTSPTGHLLAPLLPGLHLTPCQRSRLSHTSRPRNQPPQFHACHNIHNSPSFMAVLPRFHKTLTLATAHTTKHSLCWDLRIERGIIILLLTRH